jgi:hypothetical protein
MFSAEPILWENIIVSRSTSSRKERMGFKDLNSPGLLALFALQVHRHHPPRQVLHPFLVGQLGFCLGVEFPYLRR